MTDEKSSLLSKTQRKRLKEDDDLDRMTRSRIRDRVNQGFRDFVTLSDYLPDDERQKLFNKGSGENLQQPRHPKDLDSATEFYRGLAAMLTFIYSGLKKDLGWDTEDIEFLVEEAIQNAESDSPLHVAGESYRTAKPNVDINPNVEYVVGEEEARDRLRSGETMTPEDYGTALMGVDREKLVEFLEREGEM